MESRTNNIQNAFEANQKTDLLKMSIRCLFMMQIEIEKINNAFETKFLEYLNFLQENKITNEILPQNKIHDEKQFNYQYSHILSSLTDNYKSYCNYSIKDNSDCLKALQANFNDGNLKHYENYQGFKNVYIPYTDNNMSNYNKNNYLNFSNIGSNYNNYDYNNDINNQLFLCLSENINENRIDPSKCRNIKNKMNIEPNDEMDLNDAIEGSNFSNPENNTIKLNNNLMFYDAQSHQANNNLNFKSGNDNLNEAIENGVKKTPVKYAYKENKVLKQKFLEALAANKNNKKHFQVVYMFKKRIKRMFRIDCMTRKINVNFFHYLKENEKRLNLDPELLNLIRNNIRYTSKNKFQIYEEKYPNFRRYYEEFLESQKFKDLINTIKNKYDYEYVKLFFRHSLNFLHYYLK